MKARAKFKVFKITKYYLGTPQAVILMPIDTDSAPENAKFWEKNPNGKIELNIDNPETFKLFEGMGEFYVDFTPAE